MCSITGLLATGTSGFGNTVVSGSNLEPTPAANTIAFMRLKSSATLKVNALRDDYVSNIPTYGLRLMPGMLIIQRVV